MSKVEPGGSADVPEIPDGLYVATVKSVTDITLDQPDNFGNSEKVEIQLAFTDSEGTAQTLEPRVNRKWGEMATLFKIAEACGMNVDPHVTFETEDLIERRCNILVETPEEGKWPRVKSYSRLRTGKASAPSKKAVEPSVKVATSPANDEVAAYDQAEAVNQFDITEWWAAVFKAGLKREAVIERSKEMFKVEPIELNSEERVSLYLSLS